MSLHSHVTACKLRQFAGHKSSCGASSGVLAVSRANSGFIDSVKPLNHGWRVIIGGALFTAAVKADLVFLIVDCSCCTLGESASGGLLSAKLQATGHNMAAKGHESAHGQHTCWTPRPWGAITAASSSTLPDSAFHIMSRSVLQGKRLVLTNMLHARLVGVHA